MPSLGTPTKYTELEPNELDMQTTLDVFKCEIGQECTQGGEARSIGWVLEEVENDRGIFEVVSWVPAMAKGMRGWGQDGFRSLACFDCGTEYNEGLKGI